MTTASASRSNLWQGIAALIALLIATLVFGFDIVGRFCVFAAPALNVAQALRRGQFPFVFGSHDLKRSSDPLGFWSAVFIGVVIAGAGLWFFVELLTEGGHGR